MDTAGLGFLQTKASSNRAQPLADRRLCQAILPINQTIEKWKSGTHPVKSLFPAYEKVIIRQEG